MLARKKDITVAVPSVIKQGGRYCGCASLLADKEIGYGYKFTHVGLRAQLCCCASLGEGAIVA